MANVAILHHIGFAFHAKLASGTDILFRFVSFKIRNRVDFRTNKALFKVSVDDSSSLWSSGSNRNSPRPHLCFTGSKKALHAEHAVGFASEHAQRWLSKTCTGQHITSIGLIEFGDLSLKLCTDGHD